MSRCTHCGSLNPPDGRFCEECGAKLEQVQFSPATIEITIGREDDNTVVIPHTYSQVSRHHARIILMAGELWIEDLSTANGTTVNGTPVARRTPFKLRDEIHLGSHAFKTDLLLPHIAVGSPPNALVPSPLPAQEKPPAPAPVPKPVSPEPANPVNVMVVQAPPPATPPASKYSCPSCGAENIVREGIQERSGGGGGGCIGCLLVIIIIILAPGLMCGMGIISGAIFYTFQFEIIVGVVVMLVISLITRLAMANRYLCQRCGSRFRL